MAFTTEEKKSFEQLLKNLKIQNSQGWKNFARNIQLPDVKVVDLDSITHLQAVLAEIYSYNESKKPEDRIITRVSAGGRGTNYSESFSFTPGANAHVILRLVGNAFRQMEVIEKNNIVRLGPSLQLGEVDENLYKQGFMLSTSPIIPYVTVAGLVANAGHGTGENQPSVAGLIDAMTICLANGKIVRIKNPGANLPSTPYDIDISAEEFANIRGAHLGAFGVVLDVEMRLAPAHKMHCIMDVMSLPEFIEKTKNGLFSSHLYTTVLYAPCYQKDELTNTSINNVIVYYYEPVPLDTPNKKYYPLYTQWKEKMEIKLHDLLQIAQILQKYPKLTPYYMRYFVTRATVGDYDREMTGPWPMFHRAAFPSYINDADYLFEVTPDANQIVQGFTILVEALEKAAARGEFPMDYAACARYLEGTPGGLSTSSHGPGKKICGFDIVASPNLPGQEAFQDDLQRGFTEKLNAKLHWGKYIPKIDYTKMYGKDYESFMTTLKGWHEKHHLSFEKNMFINPFLADILHLPAPNLLMNTAPALPTKTKSPFCQSQTIKDIIKLVKGEDVYAVSLRKEIEKSTYSIFTKATQILFHPRQSLKNRQETTKEKGMQWQI